MMTDKKPVLKKYVSAKVAGKKYRVFARNGKEALDALKAAMRKDNPILAKEFDKKTGTTPDPTMEMAIKVTKQELKDNPEWVELGYKAGDIIAMKSQKAKAVSNKKA